VTLEHAEVSLTARQHHALHLAAVSLARRRDDHQLDTHASLLAFSSTSSIVLTM